MNEFSQKKKTTVATLNSLQNANSIQWLYSYQLRENRLNAAHCFFIRPTKLIINYILIYKSDNILLLFFLHLYFKFIWTLICLNVNCQWLLFFVTFQLEPQNNIFFSYSQNVNKCGEHERELLKMFLLCGNLSCHSYRVVIFLFVQVDKRKSEEELCKKKTKNHPATNWKMSLLHSF